MNYPACKELDADWIKRICKIGQGEETCRYLCVGPDGFMCAKHETELSNLIAKRIEKMQARGDCCSGIPMLNHLDTH